MCVQDGVSYEVTAMAGWSRPVECSAHPGCAATATCTRCAKALCGVCTAYALREPSCSSCARSRAWRHGAKKALLGLVAIYTIGGALVLGSRKLDAMAVVNEQKKAVAAAAKAEADRDADLEPMSDALAKEPCDRRVAGEYATALLGRGKARPALEAAEAFLGRCGQNLELGAIVYEAHRRLSEHDGAIDAASKLIAADPQQATYLAWRGFSYEDKGELAKAVDDFGKSLVLEPAMGGIPFNIASDLERLDRRCEASAPLETWLTHHEQSRGAEEIRVRIDQIDADPRCIAAAGTDRAVIHFAPHGREMRASVTLNDKLHVRMVVDTGATQVSLSRATAERLGMKVDRLAKIRLGTANGTGVAHVGYIDSITLGPLRLEHVSVTIPENLADDQLLLGQSFLSRFEQKIDPAAGTMQLSRKHRK